MPKRRRVILRMHMTSMMNASIWRGIVNHLRATSTMAYAFAAIRLVLGGQLDVLLASMSVAERRRDGGLVAVSIVGSAVSQARGMRRSTGDAGFVGDAVVVVMTMFLLGDDGAAAHASEFGVVGFLVGFPEGCFFVAGCGAVGADAVGAEGSHFGGFVRGLGPSVAFPEWLLLSGTRGVTVGWTWAVTLLSLVLPAQ